MQMACIEGARNLAGIADASTTEFGETSEPVVGMITEWMSEEGLQKRAAGGDLGGTMRLGAYPAKLDGNSVVRSHLRQGRDQRAPPPSLRGQRPLSRRAREGAGLVFSGMSPDGQLPEIVERPDHPWFIGVQFHPELKSRPFEPHPLFAGFIEAAREADRGWSNRAERRNALARFDPLRGAVTTKEEFAMLLTIAIILLILWALGFFAFHVAGGLIHLLLVIGIIVLIWNFVARHAAPSRRLSLQALRGR